MANMSNSPALKTYSKAALSFEQQIQKLQHDGMTIDDVPTAVQKLSVISYFRLSGYWQPMRQRDANSGQIQDGFEDGAKFVDVLALYEFDQQLRTLVLAAIERIEVAVRTQFTYQLAHAYGAFGYANAANFHPHFNHADWLHKLMDEVARSKDVFLNHYKSTYVGYPAVPVWMLTEVMSLGSLSHGYKGLRNDKKQGVEDKKSIAQFFNLHHKRLEEWLHTFTYIRNICAHHGRLWNRELAIRPDQTKEPAWQAPITPRNDRIFYAMLMIRHMLLRIGGSQEWAVQVNQLLDPLCQSNRWRTAMGVPHGWRAHPLWTSH